MVALLLPFLALAILEIALRIGGYGYSTNFFKPMRHEGKTVLVDNETFSLRFFPPELARWPSSFQFAAAKSPDTIRIFIFGESAAMGDPQPAFGAGRFLNVLLRERFPEKKFEVVNLGVTAINSHVILPIAQECARYESDFWIVYMGNNEMVGPFGAASVFGSRAPSQTAVRLNLAIQKARTGQLLVSWLRNLGGKPKNTSWGGMQMFLENQVPPTDSRKEIVYKNFSANLRAIVEAGLDTGKKVVLSTVSVNLRDCPPFASVANSNLPATDRERFQKIFSEAASLQAQSNVVAASELFGQAAKLDGQFADAHFRQAQCLLTVSNTSAREHFQLACDQDALPFRADSRINGIIRQLAGEMERNNFSLCDAEHELAQAGFNQVAGQESFYEHVHLNFSGSYRLARAWAEQIARSLPEDVKKNSRPDWLNQSDCEKLLGLTIWNRQFVLQSVIRRLGQPPLSTQPNSAERLQILQTEEQELRRRQSEPDAITRVREDFQALVSQYPDDSFLFESLGNFCEAIGDRQGARLAYQRILELIPQDYYASLQLGRVLGELGQPDQGQVHLEQTVRLRPSLPDGWHELGMVLAAQEKLEPALDCMRRAEQLRPQDPANVCYTGKVLAKMNRRAEAIEHYRRAIQMRSGFWEAHFELAGELAAQNQVPEAIHEYAEVLKINPRHALSHVNLGVMLVRVNRLDDAIARFQEALRLEPDNRVARDYLAQVQSRQRSPR